LQCGLFRSNFALPMAVNLFLVKSVSVCSVSFSALSCQSSGMSESTPPEGGLTSGMHE
jgi:hypothetical protein